MNNEIQTNKIETKNNLVVHGESPENASQMLFKVIASAASNPDVDVNKMKQLLDMQERVIDKEAKSEYFKSMNLAQQEMPVVIKTCSNNQTNSKFAKLEHIISTCSKVWTSHGFSLSFGTGEASKDGFIRITCKTIHRAGHIEESYYDLPIDDKGVKGAANKTGVHGSASTISYGRRYLTCLIFNLATFDDNDGNAPEPSQNETSEISADECLEIVEACAAAKIDLSDLLRVAGVEKVSLIQASRFGAAMGWIKKQGDKNANIS